MKNSTRTMISFVPILMFSAAMLAQQQACIYRIKVPSGDHPSDLGTAGDLEYIAYKPSGDQGECERASARVRQAVAKEVEATESERSKAFKAQLDLQYSPVESKPPAQSLEQISRDLEERRIKREALQKSIERARAQVSAAEERLKTLKGVQQGLGPCTCQPTAPAVPSPAERSHKPGHQTSPSTVLQPPEPSNEINGHSKSRPKDSVVPSQNNFPIDGKKENPATTSFGKTSANISADQPSTDNKDNSVASDSSPAAKDASRQALEMLKDPFNSGTRATDSKPPSKRASLEDELPNPFAPTSKKEQSDGAFKVSSPIAEDFKNHVVKTLDSDLAEIERLAANHTLSPAQVARATEELKDQKQVLSGLSRMMKGLEYAGAAADIYRADTDVKKQEAGGKLLLKFTTDVSKFGISKVAPKLFGEVTAAVLGGPVTFVTVIASETLSSEKIARDPTDVIRDTSGHSSLADKQHALFEEWNWYQKNGVTWGEAQKSELVQNTDLVYKEYLKQEKVRKRAETAPHQ